MNHLPPILLTSSVVAMDQSVHLKDEKLRIFHTLESIGKWLQICPHANLVICDGSGFDFSPLIHEKFPGAIIECLFFNNNANLIRLHGKGYGEGEIILHALSHSKILFNATWFAKCTAKLWVDNFDSCIQEWNGRFLCKAYFSNVFSFKKTFIEYIDTRFYLVDKSFYKANLSDAHLNIGVDDVQGVEEKFLAAVKNRAIKKFLFRKSPVVSGVGGGSGRYYNTSLIRRIKELIRLKVVQLNPSFRSLFR